ncbi:butyryl-CoA dehydrogenase [Spinactinospora alkalitolerans]|uniref:Butyryl-CoA dehydrogenase n=1 Tax=Spinactinospora alkalitolerans TaxID=687207 RepID=A0A852TWN0_9ACTN|nr:acyl-CoA dehydrogenase family protein [Spinactinospora alkalitolerans]NYE47717.1 butyryl-CoA dehydrogenase [Spinactinospora alkalitolerans]
MSAFELSEEQQHLKETAARLAADVYAPHAAEWDRERTFLPAEERLRLGKLGLLGIALPEEYGGSGAPLMDALIVVEELAKVCRPAAFQVFEANTGPARVVALMGTEEQKQRFLPGIAGGEATMAVGISEPDAGSAATDMTTSARKVGGEFVVNGTKRWISGGGHAEYYLLYARMDEAPGHRGIGAVVVEADTPGLTFGPQEQLMGFRGIPSCDLIFDDARVPVENMVVEPGGFRDLFRAFSIERLGNATMSLAIGQAALDRSARYVREREQFGKPLAEFQTVQSILADMLIQVESARLLIHRAAANAGTGLPDPLEASLAKCHANEMAKRVSDLGMQLHGGNGYTEEFGLERLHRDAHGWAIAGGTPAMQRVRIASQMLGRRFGQR